MTNQEAIRQLKRLKADCEFQIKISRFDITKDRCQELATATEMAIAALEKQEREKWHPINPDEPDSFPDNDRTVLVEFENADGVDTANFITDDEGGAFYSHGKAYAYKVYGIYVKAWRELPEL